MGIGELYFSGSTSSLKAKPKDIIRANWRHRALFITIWWRLQMALD